MCKTQKVLNNYSSVAVSVSGGSDSDIMLAIINELKHDLTPTIHYLYYDTGLEYKATKEHIKYLSDRYKIDTETFKAHPLLWYTDLDKAIVEKLLNVKHSNCYSMYGLKRTGCAGCPFGQHYKDELNIIQQYEPKLYKACINVFGKSYDYTNKFMNERW